MSSHESLPTGGDTGNSALRRVDEDGVATTAESSEAAQWTISSETPSAPTLHAADFTAGESRKLAMARTLMQTTRSDHPDTWHLTVEHLKDLHYEFLDDLVKLKACPAKVETDDIEVYSEDVQDKITAFWNCTERATSHWEAVTDEIIETYQYLLGAVEPQPEPEDREKCSGNPDPAKDTESPEEIKLIAKLMSSAVTIIDVHLVHTDSHIGATAGWMKTLDGHIQAKAKDSEQQGLRDMLTHVWPDILNGYTDVHIAHQSTCLRAGALESLEALAQAFTSRTLPAHPTLMEQIHVQDSLKPFADFATHLRKDWGMDAGTSDADPMTYLGARSYLDAMDGV